MTCAISRKGSSPAESPSGHRTSRLGDSKAAGTGGTVHASSPPPSGSGRGAPPSSASLDPPPSSPAPSAAAPSGRPGPPAPLDPQSHAPVVAPNPSTNASVHPYPYRI